MSQQKFTAPKYSPIGKRVYEIPFSISVGATSHLTQVSTAIPFNFKVLKVKMYFPEEADNNVLHGWYVSGDRSGSTTGTPSGTNIFSPSAPVTNFRGKAVVREAESNREFRDPVQYIKFYTYNGNAYAYWAVGSITIEEID